jgi:hypothetical protein
MTLVGEIEFPPEWKAGKPWGKGFPQIMLSHEDGTIFAAGGALVDGSNLVGLCFPGGQRVYRMSPDTDWAIEERFEGDAPEVAQDVWRVLVDCAVRALRSAEEELGGRPRR